LFRLQRGADSALVESDGGSVNRLVPKKYRHVFTLEADEVIRAEYRRMLQGRRPYAVKERLGAKLGVPGWVTQRRATELGLSRIKEPRWTEDELELLARHATKSPQKIAAIFHAKGFPRSQNAVWLMLKRRLGGVRMNRSWYTATQLAGMLGIDSHAVVRWISSGQLPAERAGTLRTERQGGDLYVIKPSDLRLFIYRNPHAVDLRKVNQLWFIDLLANSDANRYEEVNLLRQRLRPSARAMRKALEQILADAENFDIHIGAERASLIRSAIGLTEERRQ
jgi:hypothetical protein